MSAVRIDKVVVERAIRAMEHSIHFHETGNGRPPDQLLCNAIDELRAALSQTATLTETVIRKMMMALLQCSDSDLDSYSPGFYIIYRDDVIRVYSALES